MDRVSTLIFDYGGCIDAHGVHTRKLYERAFKANHLEIDRETLQDSYTFAYLTILEAGLAVKLPLLDYNELMLKWMSQALDEPSVERDQIRIAQTITSWQRKSLSENAPILQELSKNYRLGIVSNYSGNLEIILKEHSLRDYFDFVIDSYHAGASKPSREVFELALEKASEPASNCLFIGDHPERDVAASQSVGMKAILIHEAGTRASPGADGQITRLAELPNLLSEGLSCLTH